jgi:hypothetical protein
MTRPNASWQRGLQHFNGCLFQPDSSTAGGKGLGGIWTTDTAAVGITVAHATVGTAFDTQLKRTTYANVAGTADQELGPRLANAGDYQFWIGNDTTNHDYLGGFYFSAIFRIGTWNSDGGRIFVGLTASANPVCISDTEPANTIGLWHESTDGQDVFSIVTVTNASAVTKTSVTTHGANPGILAAGVTLLWEMWAFPSSNGTVNANYRLSYFDPTNKYVSKVTWGAIGGGPLNTVMMAPQCQMSNGADTTAAHYKIEVANVYCTPPSGELL